MKPAMERASNGVRVAALVLVVALAAGPLGTHVYWLLGGTWGLHRTVDGERVMEEGATSTGIRILAAVVVVLLVAAVLVVLARVGFWRQALVPDRAVLFLTWALAAVFLLEALASFTWSRQNEWWMYGPVSLVIGALTLAVAASGRSVCRTDKERRSS